MNKEEIVERIKVCEKCESNYRKVNKLDRASAFNYEKIKWGTLLSKLEKADIYKQALIDIREYLKTGRDVSIYEFAIDILQIIDTVLGDEK